MTREAAPVAASDAEANSVGLTRDAFFGGALWLEQPARGYRAGLDALLLAAAVPVSEERPTMVLDLGAGVGTVGLAIATRVKSARIVLLERDPALASLAHGNTIANGLGDRVRSVTADIAAPAAELERLGLAADSFDHAAANPPYFIDGDGTRATLAQRAGSRAMPVTALDDWLRAAARAVRPGGTLTMIHRVEALGALLAGLEGRFGGIAVLPLSAGRAAPATRILLNARKGSRGPLRLLAPLISHTENGGFTPEIQAIIGQPSGHGCFRTV
jgi:tRNA1(Val) A37 N6-methylase TrmN6